MKKVTLKRYLSLLGVFIMAFNLFGCSFLKKHMYAGEDIKEERIARSIVGAIEKKDREMLKSVFSKEALNYTMDFEDGMDYIFEFLKGNVQEVKSRSGRTQEHREKDANVLELYSKFNVLTDQGAYILYFHHFLVNDKKPEKVGVGQIILYDKEVVESTSPYSWGPDYPNFGIYNPGWDEGTMKVPNESKEVTKETITPENLNMDVQVVSFENETGAMLAGGVVNQTTVNIDSLLLVVTVEGETYSLGTYPHQEMTTENPYHLPAGGRALFVDIRSSKSKQGIPMDPKYVAKKVNIEICSMTIDGESIQFNYNNDTKSFEKAN